MEERQRREQKKAEDRRLAEEERKYEENARARKEVLEKQQMDLRVREIERLRWQEIKSKRTDGIAL